ncbi:MAG: peptide ABC transporter substrate-binding protein [Sphingomonadales bacterium]|jgi:oligopeptide transport system substrate-binding protein
MFGPRNYFGKFSSFLYVLMAIALLSGCEPTQKNTEESPAENGPHTEKVLKIGSTTQPRSLDPQKSNLVAGRRVVSALFQGLIDVDASGRLIPGMAQGWDVSEDGLHYTFTLREAYWSDGTPVTTEDFIFSFRSLFGKQSESSFTSFYMVLKNATAVKAGDLPIEELGVRALNERILRLDLEHPFPSLLGLLSHQSALPVPSHALQKFGANWTAPENLVVNGAFKLQSWGDGEPIILVKNPMFHDAETVALDRIEIHNSANADAALDAFLAGELDIIDSFPDERLGEIQETIPQSLRVEPQWSIYWYVFNTQDEILSDSRIRQALSMALDRERITGTILSQTGNRPSYSLVPPEMPSYGTPNTPDWFVLDMAGRREFAIELLSAAGYGPENPLTLTISFNRSEDHRRVMEAVAEDWQQIGVSVMADEEDFQGHLAKLEAGDFQIGRRTWVASFDMPEYFLGLFTRDAGPLNIGRYINPRFDEVMDEARSKSNLSERTMLLREAESIALADSVVAPIYSYVNQVLVRPYVKGWIDNPTSRHALRFLDVKEKAATPSHTPPR